MSKQLTVEQWLELFSIYKKSKSLCWKKLSEYKKVTIDTKKWFKKKIRKYMCHNEDMTILISKTGKSPKKNKGSGRPRKEQTKHEIWKEFIRDVGEDEIARIIGELMQEGDNKLSEKIKKIIRKTKLSSRKLETILNISKSKICYIRKKDFTASYKSRKNKWLQQMIEEIMKKYKYRIGRKPVAQIIYKEYGVRYSDRQIGRIMSENGIKCNIRKPRRSKESKNITANVNDIVLRDYDNVNHDFEIYATDVTYIPSTKDCHENHVYLSTIISHKTKEIVGWKLSKNNDLELVLDSFESIVNKQKNIIIHSDHGSVYSSKYFKNMLLKNDWIQSMSRVGNSLDNRVIEFWFSILKTELIYKLNISELNFCELENYISEFIDYYNNGRIQEKLNWMTPNQYRLNL